MTDTPPTPQNGVLYWMWSLEKLAPAPWDNACANVAAARAEYKKRFGVEPEKSIYEWGYILCGPVPEGMTK